MCKRPAIELMFATSNYGGRTPLSPHAQATIEKHIPNAKQLIYCQAPVSIQKRDASCITDVCSSEHLPEIEIISLLEEQIPKYKIRSDAMTKFGGYENQDWYIPFPTLPIPNDGLGLSKEQVRETLNYFILSGERVSQMTKAYDDIEAVTRLLEEKEKDLELTVQIGKELLAQNNKLESKLVELEVNLKNINDNYQQLSHEVIQKNALISILTNDVDGTNTGCDTPTTPTSSSTKSINLEFLQKKISSLQDENVSLRRETLQLARDTDEIEDKEKRLMEEITNQLHSTNSQYDGLNLELERHKEENRLLHEQVTNLTLRLNETELRFHDLSTENEETMSVLSITKENQNMLANELVDFKERYQEVLSLLNETQEQLRNAKKRNQPTARTSLIPGLPTAQVESLQSELMETSMFSENSLDSGIALDRIGSGSTLNLGGFKKVFDTVKCVSKANTFNDPSMLHLGVMSMSSVSQPKMATLIQSTDSTNLYRTSSVPYTNSFSMESSMGARVYSRDSLTSDTESNYPAQAPSGCPGAPGAKDLEAALNRLTPAEVLARRAMLSHAPVGTYNYDETGTNLPLGIRTPDSIMSVGSYSMTGSGYSHHPQWRLPDKLQIVKPMEGSQTLRNWNRLATPTLSGLLEERPGVTIRGGRGLDDLGLQVYSLDDCEEDIEDHPGKRFPSSSCVYTFTNSTVMHPDDGTSIISSVPSSRMSSHNVSRQSSAPMTPRASLSRRNSCSTFSVNLGLASMLNERGIKAVTPSALNTPCGINYSPTVTPCNSPEGSPERTMSPEPQFLSGLLSSGADMLRRKLIGEVIESKQQKPLRPINKVMLSRLEKRALKSLKILEKVEHMGIESITPPNHPHLCPLPPLQGTSSLYSSRSASPMAQLTSLKKLGSLDSDEVLINRRTIKAILSKGLSNDNLRSLDLSSDDSDSSCISSLSTSLSSSTKKTLDKSVIHPTMKSATPTVVGSTTSTTNEVGSARMKQMQRQKSRRNIKNGHGGQRPDLGTVGGNNSNIIKNNINNNNNSKTSDKEQQPIGFIGSISSLLFGRKGGLL